MRFVYLVFLIPILASCGLSLMQAGDGGSTSSSGGSTTSSSGGGNSGGSCGVSLAIHRKDVVIGGPVHLTASGGSGAYTYDDGGAGGSFGGTTYTASGSPASVILRATDGNGCAATKALKVRNPLGDFFVGFDLWTGAVAKSGVYGFSLNYTNNAFSALTPAGYSYLSPTKIRAMAIDTYDRLFAGFDLLTPQAYQLSASAPQTAPLAGPITFPSAGGGALSDVHAMCFLPDGTVIASDSSGHSNQYDAAGNYLRSVYTATISAISDCYALSATRVLLVDGDAFTLSNGELLEVDLAGGVWSPSTNRTGALASFNGSTSTFIWRMVVHPDGYVYLPPGKTGGAQVQSIIRCPIDNLPQANCTIVGPSYPIGSILQGAGLIPGTDDLLILTYDGNIYRYNYAAQTYTAILGFTNGVGGGSQIPDYQFARNLMLW